MSKKWKIAIGVIVSAVVIAGVALVAWGAVTFREWRVENGEWRTEEVAQLEVRLVDDDGDGIPDRGVIEVPEDLQHGWGYGPHFGSGHRPRFGRGFGPLTALRTGPHFSWGFGPFRIVGGLFRLAFLALLIGLAVVCCRRWGRPRGERDLQ